MSGPISIGSEAEWQNLLSGTSVVVADCTYSATVTDYVLIS